MRIPDRLGLLMEQGVIQEVLRPLQSGKEAQVFLVVAQDTLCVAKVYKEVAHRSFKHRADYTEGRKVRNTREARAMAKGSRYGRAQVEEAWRNAEVDTIYRLRAAEVDVPEPYDFIDGVLLMEFVQDGGGEPAPRLADVDLTPEEAEWIFRRLLRQVVKMLCAGVVHGDLSDFNVLLAPDGPVIIDFPQAVDPAHNNNARKLLIRDCHNLTNFLGRYDTSLKGMKFGEEMWELYENGSLTPDTPLTGRWESRAGKADVNAVLREIEALERESLARREALGLGPPRKARAPVQFEGPAPRPASEGRADRGGKTKPDRPQGRDRAPEPARDPRGGRPPEPARGARPPEPTRHERQDRGSGRPDRPPARPDRSPRPDDRRPLPRIDELDDLLSIDD